MHGSRVGFPAKRYGNRIARRRARHLAADGLRHARFGGVNNIVGRHWINDDARQRGIDLHVMAGGIAVARAVGDARRHRVTGFAQRTDGGGGYRGAPVACGVRRRGVILPVKRQRNRGACWLITGAGNLQIRTFFRGVNDVIGGDGVDANGRRGKVDGDRVRLTIAVTCRIANGGGDSLRAAAQRCDIRRRNADAPVAGGIQGGGVGFTV